MSYRKGKGISLIGRIKVLSTFILSRLWYRTNIWNLIILQKNTLQTMIRNFVWNDKKGARVRQGVLQLKYSKGGLQLVDIEGKVKVKTL